MLAACRILNLQPASQNELRTPAQPERGRSSTASPNSHAMRACPPAHANQVEPQPTHRCLQPLRRSVLGPKGTPGLPRRFSAVRSCGMGTSCSGSLGHRVSRTYRQPSFFLKWSFQSRQGGSGIAISLIKLHCLIQCVYYYYDGPDGSLLFMVAFLLGVNDSRVIVIVHKGPCTSDSVNKHGHVQKLIAKLGRTMHFHNTCTSTSWST